MKIKLIFSVSLFFACFFSLSLVKGQSNFNNSYTNIQGEVWDIVKTKDANIALLANNCSMAVLKIDNTGNLLWSNQHIWHATSSYLQSITALNDSGIVALSLSHGPIEAEVVKYNNAGFREWAKIYFTSLRSVTATNDGGFVLAGGHNVLKCNANGNIVWQKTLFDINPSKIIETVTGDFIVYGLISVAGAGSDACILRISSSGNVLWAKSFGGNASEFTTSIIETSDGGFTMCGNSYSFGTSYTQPFLLHINTAGNLEWFKVYHTNTETLFYDINELGDGNVFVAGTVLYNDIRNVQVLYFKSDSIGNVIWARSAGNAGFDESRCTVLSDDGSIFLGLSTNGMGVTKLDTMGLGFCTFDTINFNIAAPSITLSNQAILSINAFITDSIITPALIPNAFSPVYFCTDVTGVSTIEDSEENTNTLVYPNPFYDQLYIKSTAEILMQFSLYDVAGRRIMQESCKHSSYFKTDKLEKGVYFYQLTDKNKIIIESGKIVKN